MPRLLLAGAVGAVLAGCGGGGSGDGGNGGGGGFGADENLDGITDVTLDTDQDNDGVDDVDVDGDGQPDFDFNNDGIRDTDVNNDDSVDLTVLDEFGLLAGFDTNGDGEADLDVDRQPINTPPPGAGVLACPNGGTDATSADDQWNNNCTLRNGVTSYYTRGVQRILYCLGFDNGATQIGTFADAQYGGGTASAVRAYQQERNLTVDGTVGTQTWGALRDELVVLPTSDDNLANRDRSYAVANPVADPACVDQVQFYRTLRTGSDTEFGGWKIANNPGETGQAARVEFSVRNPFQ